VYVVVTMAGAGSRFRAAGYARPKYEIEVRGRSLFAWSQSSLAAFRDAGWRWIFVTRRQDDAAAFVRTEARSLNIHDPALVELETTTDGQATTVLHARAAIEEPSRPIIVYNIDTFVDPAHLRPSDARGDGWLPCFPGDGKAWSFVRLGPDGRVAEVREKRRISRHATIGLYYFNSFELYQSIYERHRSAGSDAERCERFVAPLYNTLIAQGGEVRIQTLPREAVHPLGTPAEVQAFSAPRRSPS
jgi:dTDP-glucose pyrophosphorylase